MDDATPKGLSEDEIFIPAADFRDPSREALEKERLWPRVWQMACREEELPNVGDFVVYEILDDSILIVRTGSEPDAFSAFYNVCQHRGRRLRDDKKGNLGAGLSCRFHGWKYGLSGELLGVYMEHDWAQCPSFSRSNLDIPKVKLARWGGWIWINQDPQAEPLEAWLGPLADILEPFDFASMRPVWWKTIDTRVNWKIVVEAFNEGHHSGATHTSGINYGPLRYPTATSGPHGMFYVDGPTMTNYRERDGAGWASTWKKPKTFQENLWANHRHLYSHLLAMTLKPGMAAAERVRALPAETPPETVISKMYEFHREEIERTGARWPAKMTFETFLRSPTGVHIFPNSLPLPTLDGVLWYRLRPHPSDYGRCVFDMWSFGRFAPGAEPKVEQEFYAGLEAFKGQCPFLEEDFQNFEAVNEGVKNRGFRGATINPRQEATISHFRKMLTLFVGLESGKSEGGR